jgi:hypothetical protein
MFRFEAFKQGSKTRNKTVLRLRPLRKSVLLGIKTNVIIFNFRYTKNVFLDFMTKIVKKTGNCCYMNMSNQMAKNINYFLQFSKDMRFKVFISKNQYYLHFRNKTVTS